MRAHQEWRQVYQMRTQPLLRAERYKERAAQILVAEVSGIAILVCSWEAAIAVKIMTTPNKCPPSMGFDPIFWLARAELSHREYRRSTLHI